MNWINGFDAGNKKEKYSLTFRLGTFTVLEIKIESNKLNVPKLFVSKSITFSPVFRFIK